MIENQFAYCPLIWMFYLKTHMERIYKGYCKYITLQVMYNNYMATYNNLSALDNNMRTYQRHFCSSYPLSYINLKI